VLISVEIPTGISIARRVQLAIAGAVVVIRRGVLDAMVLPDLKRKRILPKQRTRQELCIGQ
jgi:hypothetical protein